MKTVRSLFTLLLCLLLLAGGCPRAFADGPRPFMVIVERGDREFRVRAFQDSYEGNLYLSLSDLSQALNGTEKQYRFSFNTEEKFFFILKGQSAGAEGRLLPSDPGVTTLNLYRNRLLVDGMDRRYYTYQADFDLYMSLTDVQLMLNTPLQMLEPFRLRLHPEESFTVDIKALDDSGYFDQFNGILVGDADSGEILFATNHDRIAPVASITKLMTYLLLREAADAGQISMNDQVAISARAAWLGGTADGMVDLREGSRIPLTELVTAMLLASSNECALALAEHVAGSETAFVEQMNRRAGELELRTARFYDCHGLPSYSSSSLPVKRQNCMSSLDLFRLCRYLLAHYPDVTETTSQVFAEMKELKYTCANSNPLVFNMTGVTGLKTGSTDRAGSCLAATIPVPAEDGEHTAVVLVLGAETAQLRGQAAELLTRWVWELYNGRISGEPNG